MGEDVCLSGQNISSMTTMPVEIEEEVPNNNDNLTKELERITVELEFMHKENDEMKTSFVKERATLVQECESQVYEKEKHLRATLQKMDVMKTEYCDNLQHTQTKLEEAQKLITRKDNEIDSKCDVIKSMESAQNNFEQLLVNKDEIIESQKRIIDVMRKRVSETEKIEYKMLEGNHLIAEKHAEKKPHRNWEVER